MTSQQQVIDQFESLYHQKPAFLIRGPGRVNLIGEHTDYNDGFVLPMAIDRAVWIALRPRSDRVVRVHPLDFDDEITFSLDQLEKAPASPAEYIKGTAWALQETGIALSGWEGVLKGDVPIGAGLSSSAALEMAAARAFTALNGQSWDAPVMARLGQKAENQWVGVNTGIMDQMISAAGKSGHALLIDCRSLETFLAPLPQGTAVVVLDTSTRRGLVHSAYNERRAQCEAAAKFFGVRALRDVSLAQFEARAQELDEITRKRARHVIAENERTLAAKTAMERDDAVILGELMNASHDSLRDDFEVSNNALNAIVEAARRHAACYGARMTGAGFGGCAVALVKQADSADFADVVSRVYQENTGLTAQVYICQASNGAELMPVG